MTEELRSVLGEFRVLSPDITTAVVFRSNGEDIAATEDTTPEQTQTLIANLTSITHAECIGGIENLTIQDVNTQLTVNAVDEVYFAVVALRGGEQKVVKSLTEVVAPTIIRLALGSLVVEPKKPEFMTETFEEKTETEVLAAQEPAFEPIAEPASLEPPLPKAPTTQFMVEKIGGILVPPDAVRIDGEVVEKWRELYGNRQFTTVHIETLEGKTLTCKFKPLKDTRANEKGMIQIPERIIQMLGSGRGKLVMVKPAVKEGD
ncbi:MAG: hypothetical protein M1167_00410 [Chloroflexi bacterium]|nr:hypothetical protein [Chloroflexota bacterium]